MPLAEIPFWMLLNRTCHVYEGEGRVPKLAYLNYIAVYPIELFVEGPGKVSNQVHKIIKDHEGSIFLPANAALGVNSHLVGVFNLVHSIPLSQAPSASEKCLQLASPFAEYAFQKLAAFFYTVGFDDARIKSTAFIDEVVKIVEDHRVRTGEVKK